MRTSIDQYRFLKKNLVLVQLLILQVTAQEWLTAVQLDGEGYDIRADSRGQCYVFGITCCPVYDSQNNQTRCKCEHKSTIWKYDYEHSKGWQTTYGGTDFDVATGGTLNRNESYLFVTGVYSDSIVFDDGSKHYSEKEGQYTYLLKLDSSGRNHMITGDIGGSGWRLDQDDAGNIYIGGFYTNSCVIGDDTLRGSDGLNSFVAQFSPELQYHWAAMGDPNRHSWTAELVAIPGGVCVAENHRIWAVRSDGTTNWISDEEDRSESEKRYTSTVYCRKFDNIYVAGFAGDTSLNSISNADSMLIECYAPSDGTRLWRRTASNAKIESIDTDTTGDIYIAGEYNTHIAIDNVLRTENDTLNKVFVAKFTPTGECLWIKSLKTSGGKKIRSFTVGRPDESYLLLSTETHHNTAQRSVTTLDTTLLFGCGTHHYFAYLGKRPAALQDDFRPGYLSRSKAMRPDQFYDLLGRSLTRSIRNRDLAAKFTGIYLSNSEGIRIRMSP